MQPFETALGRGAQGAGL